MIYILGNHEYYGNRYPNLITKARQAAGTRVHVLENEFVDIDGIRFHGATLWTNFELFGDARIAGYECQQTMNDFRRIRKEPSYSKLLARDVSGIHHGSLKWLSESLRRSDKAVNIVVTHHAPSLKSVPKRYRSDIVSAAYASNLESFIEDHKPDYWLHGHLHSSSSYQIGLCTVVCNPRGYEDELNELFDPNFTICLD